MTLGESIVRESRHLVEDFIGDRTDDPTFGHTGVQAIAKASHTFGTALRPHGLTQLIGFGWRETGDVDRHLHELLLEQRDSEGLAETVLEQRMQIGDRLLTITSTDVGVYRSTLNGSGSDERDLHHQVVETTRFEPRQCGHLSTRLDLEHTDRVGSAQHGVHVVVLWECRQIEFDSFDLAYEIDCAVQGRQHTESEKVELHEPGRCAVVLVPLQHTAIAHGGPLDRTHLDHRSIADHHSARMNTEMTWHVFDACRQFENVGRNAVIGPSVRAGLLDHLLYPPPSIDLFRPGVLLTRGISESACHVAYGRTSAIRDHVGDLGRVMPAVTLVHVLDDLFASTALDVEIDVGWPVSFRGQESFEEQTERHRIGLRDTERITHGAVGRTTSTLAIDVGTCAELHDVPHHEEVAGETECLDDRQLVVDGAPGSRPQTQIFTRCGSVTVTTDRPVLGQTTQELHLGQPVGARIRGKTRSDEGEIEGCRPTDLGCGFDHSGIASEAPTLLVTTA